MLRLAPCGPLRPCRVLGLLVAVSATMLLPLADASAASLAVDASAPGRPVPAGFVGVSIEPPTLPTIASSESGGPVSPALVALLREFGDRQGSPLSLRLGGDSQDSTWWRPTPPRRPLSTSPYRLPLHDRRSPGRGVRREISTSWLRTLDELTRATGQSVTLGTNLGAGVPDQSAALATAVSGVLRERLSAIEVGNEPDSYPSRRARYKVRRRGRVVERPFRSARWGFSEYLSEVLRHRRAVEARGFSPALVGPALAYQGWLPQIGRFIDATGARTATVHAYPYVRPSARQIRAGRSRPTIEDLLRPGTVERVLSRFDASVAALGARGVGVRLAETNSVAHGGQPGVSDAFASALYGLELCMEANRRGLSGLNLHAGFGTSYRPFWSDGAGGVDVAPLWYGMTMCAEALRGARAVTVVPEGMPPSARAWAVEAPEGTRIVMINTDPASPVVVSLPPSPSPEPASLVRLRAPSLGARDGTTLAGQAVGADGRWGGEPVGELVPLIGGLRTVELPPASALLVSVPR